MVENTAAKQKKERRMKRNDGSFRGFGDNIKHQYSKL